MARPVVITLVTRSSGTGTPTVPPSSRTSSRARRATVQRIAPAITHTTVTSTAIHQKPVPMPKPSRTGGGTHSRRAAVMVTA